MLSYSVSVINIHLRQLSVIRTSLWWMWRHQMAHALNLLKVVSRGVLSASQTHFISCSGKCTANILSAIMAIGCGISITHRGSCVAFVLCTRVIDAIVLPNRQRRYRSVRLGARQPPLVLLAAFLGHLTVKQSVSFGCTWAVTMDRTRSVRCSLSKRSCWSVPHSACGVVSRGCHQAHPCETIRDTENTIRALLPLRCHQLYQEAKMKND